jgi:hypothetical protein
VRATRRTGLGLLAAACLAALVSLAVVGLPYERMNPGAFADVYPTPTPGAPADLTGFRLTYYTIAGDPNPNLACGSQLTQNGNSVTGTIDCSSATGGILNGTVDETTQPKEFHGTIDFAAPSALGVRFDGTISDDGSTGSGTWSCTSGCASSGTYTDSRIAPSTPECQSVPAGPPTQVTLTSSFGDQIIIPANSIGPATNICAQVISLPVGVGSGSNILSRAYLLTPEGTTFNPPATGIYHYSQDEIVPGMNEANLRVALYDSFQDRWVARRGTVDMANNTLTISIDHFSVYAVGLDCGTGPDSDSAIGNGAGIPGNDATAPNGDGIQDLCDLDDDDDRIPDALDTDPGGDMTYDDNGDGIMLNAADDGPSWDSNGNAVIDGAEATCASLAEGTDTDGDGLDDKWETCKWGTDPDALDTDGDGTGDCLEAADVNGDGIVGFVGDTIYYAKAALLPPGVFGKDGDFDINGDGIIDFAGDVIQEAKFALITGLCQ